MSLGSESIYSEILGREGDADRPAILGPGGGTYGEIRARVDRLVALLRRAGVGPGDRVGISLDSGAGYLVALLGIRAAGATAVLFGPSWTPFEAGRTFRHSGPGWILAGGDLALELTPARTLDCPEIDGRILEFGREGSGVESEPTDAVIIYTSGTTGAPKGVVLSESAVSANVRAVVAYLGLTPGDSTTVFTPTCYAYALSQFLTHALAGAAILPMPTYLRFPMAVLNGCAERRLTGLAANPTSFRILLGLETPDDWDLSSVRYLMSGGQFLDARLVMRLSARFPNARVVNMYGATENSPRISYFWLEDRGFDDASKFYPVGIAVQGTRIEIRSDDDRDLRIGEVGEVVVCGSSLMRAYWRDPESTLEKVRGGWLHTGDLGLIDADGRLVLTGRASNVINVGNEKVSPEDVERVILEVGGVAEAAVYGIPDAITGESVRAQVVLEGGAQTSSEAIIAHCRKILSGYKAPRTIQVVESLPRTLYGKLDRKKLKESRS